MAPTPAPASLASAATFPHQSCAERAEGAIRIIQRAAGRLWVLTVVLLIAVLLASAASAQEMQFNQAQLVRSLLPTVVNITAHAEVSTDASALTASAQQARRPFEIKTAAGSGFVVDPSGVIATNWHVVDGAYEIFVTFSDGSRAKATVMSAARVIDIAILRVDVGHSLTAVRWGDSSKVQIADPVLAIGNPLGIGLSVTAGIVSALNRNIMDTPVDDFIQTDAPINHGNSGGPLFDEKGEVIGINAALVSPTTAASGLGLAIPSNDAYFIIDRLMHSNWVRPGWMGVKIQPVTPEIALGLRMGEPQGSIVAAVVDDGPADLAGIRVGDVILRLDNEVPSDDRALLRKIGMSAPGRTVNVGLLRDGKDIVVPVTLAEWPKMDWEGRDAPTKAARPQLTIPRDLGLKVEPLTPELRAKNELPPDRTGVLVTGVDQETDAAQRGVKTGDVILQVGQVPVATAEEVQRQIDRLREGKWSIALFLIWPKSELDENPQFPGPKWYALQLDSD
jgi:serine protease Do